MSEQAEPSLRELFLISWKSFRNLSSIYGPELQSKIADLIPTFNHIQKSVDELDFFSINEDVDDLTTSSIPFILVNGILGNLYSKSFTSREERKKQVEKAIRHYNEFKMLTLQFNLTQVNWPSRQQKSHEDLSDRRQILIETQKEKKELDEMTDSFLKRLINDPDSLDDDFVKEMYMKCIRQLQIIVVEDMENLTLEQSFLNNPTPAKEPVANINTKPKTFIIAKDQLQKKVFGAGYPSTPTITVEEFAEQEMKKMLPSSEFALFNKQVAANQSKLHKNKWLEKEPTESDDISNEELQKERRFDDWKDDHRRGSGNRLGMG